MRNPGLDIFWGWEAAAGFPAVASRDRNALRGEITAANRFGTEAEVIVDLLLKTRPLFPCPATVQPGGRATEFQQRCAGLGIEGVTR